MKIRRHNLTNDEIARITRIKPIGGFKPGMARPVTYFLPKKIRRSQGPPLSFAICLGIGFFTFVPLTLTHGTAGGHASAMSGQGNGGRNEHGRYFNPFWSPSFLYHTGIYDSAYCYAPTPQQQATAKQQVEAYLFGVKKTANLLQPSAINQ
jgi:hypothetical protein